MSTTGWIIFFVCLFAFSLILYNFKKIKAYFSKIFKSSGKKKSNKKKDKESKDSSKVKANTGQIRPILRPPEEKKTEDKKEDKQESKKESVENSAPIQKPLEYKLDSSPAKAKEAKELMKLKTDLDKEFEDIRKYLNLPEPINIKNVNKVPGVQTESSKNVQSKSSPTGYLGSSSNDFVKGVGRAGSSANEGKFPYNSRSSFNSSETKLDNIEVSVEKDDTQLNFNSNKSFKKPMPYSYAQKKHIENKVTIDGEEIDLNKLPLNIKKLLISDILSRKNYDD